MFSRVEWDNIGFIVRSKYRKNVFLSLEKPIRPSQIAKKLDLRLTHVTRALRELKQKGFAKCLNPNERIGRLYTLTDKGKKLTKKAVVVMAPQCIYGRINMNVYNYGIKLKQAGVIPGEDMTPETALVKLAWLLGNHKKQAKDLIGKNLAGEISDRTEICIICWFII